MLAYSNQSTTTQFEASQPIISTHSVLFELHLNKRRGFAFKKAIFINAACVYKFLNNKNFILPVLTSQLLELVLVCSNQSINKHNFILHLKKRIFINANHYTDNKSQKKNSILRSSEGSHGSPPRVIRKCRSFI